MGNHALSVCHPQVIAPLLVDLRVSRSPAQSLSVNVCSSVGRSCRLNAGSSLDAPTEYRAILFSFS